MSHQDVTLVETSTFSAMPEYFALCFLLERSARPFNRKQPYQNPPIRSQLERALRVRFDIIQVALALDLEYPRIDAVRILQDVDKAKFDEIPAMGEGYEQALATVFDESISTIIDGLLRNFER